MTKETTAIMMEAIEIEFPSEIYRHERISRKTNNLLLQFGKQKIASSFYPHVIPVKKYNYYYYHFNFHS